VLVEQAREALKRTFDKCTAVLLVPLAKNRMQATKVEAVACSRLDLRDCIASIKGWLWKGEGEDLLVEGWAFCQADRLRKC
jgi:hypothetical protein